MKPLNLLSIVAPAHNECDNLEGFCARVREVLEPLGCGWELIVVDDGSTDATHEVLRRLHEQDARIKALRLSRNFGHEPASTAGLEAARGDAVILLDADLQDPPELIPDLVAAWRTGADIVNAVRVSRDGEGLLKRGTAYAFYRVMDRLTRWDFPADAGNFRLMDRKVLDAFLACEERLRLVRALTAWTGFTQVSVEFERATRHHGRSKYNWRRMISLGLIAVTTYSNDPLRIASVLGLMITPLAFVAIIALIAAALAGYPVSIAAFALVSVWFMGGVQCLLMGIIGEYLGKIAIEARRRPLYFVAERLGVETGDGTQRISGK